MRVLVPFLCLFLFACNKNDDFEIDKELELTNANLIGTWKLIRSKVSPGGPVDWSSVKNGDEFSFLKNGTYTFTDTENTTGNQAGTFSVSTENFGDILSLSYQRDNEEISYGYYVTMGANTMIIGYIGCIEECSYGYKRIN